MTSRSGALARRSASRAPGQQRHVGCDLVGQSGVFLVGGEYLVRDIAELVDDACDAVWVGDVSCHVG
ncbi:MULTISPECIES: hypothetical protein [unclassified Mycolicibacterium]|uniref:hypothetical protein n=1 Tax=unclassified Mycolicibacterium TaxID=2636767 RepID=UPI002ED8C4C6